MRDPSGAILDALVAGPWNAFTRTFDGRWVVSKQQQGSIVVRLRSP
jgi:hypothetical protein